MKKLFTLFSFAIACYSFAQTPVINGVFSPSEGWGSIRGTGTQAGASNGWESTDAQELYFTSDATYYYFGAKCVVASWMQFNFAVNSRSGGGSTDSWGRAITYAQTNLPDFMFRGNFDGAPGSYTEYHTWNGSAWTGGGTNVNAAGTEAKWTSAGGFIEIRVPKTTLVGDPLTGDIIFIITGNQGVGDAGGPNGAHGIFDAIPNQTNGTSWNLPGNATTATSYVTNITMPATLSFFKGEVKNNTATVSWLSNTENNFSHYEVEASNNASNWNKIATVAAKGNNSNYTATATINQNTWYRLKMVDKDGSFAYCNAVLLKVTGKKGNIELLGNPVKDQIKISINNDKITNYTAEIFSLDGKRMAVKNYQHAGGVTTLSIDAPSAKGTYFVRFTNNGIITDVLKVLVD